jgi:hypothetical protein
MQHLLKILVFLLLGFAPQENQTIQMFSKYVPQSAIQQVQQEMAEITDNNLELPGGKTLYDEPSNSEQDNNDFEKGKPNTEKVRAYNTASGKVVEKVAARATEKSPVLISCQDIDLCDKPEPTPSPSPQPSPPPLRDPLPSPIPTIEPIIPIPTIIEPRPPCPPPPYPPIPYGGKYELQRPMVCLY